MLTGLLIVGATIALRTDSAERVSSEEIEQLEAAISGELERIAGEPPFQDAIRGECSDTEACARSLRLSTGASDVLLVRAYAGPLRLQVTLERHRISRRDPETRELKLERNNRIEWRPQIAAALDGLFEDLARASPRLVVVEPPSAAGRESAELPLNAWLALGTGVVASAVGIAFAASYHGAASDLNARLYEPSEIRGFVNRAERDGPLAVIALSTAALAFSWAAIALAVAEP